MRKSLAALSAVAAIVLSSPAGRADDGAAPSWIKADPAAKSVVLDIVAGWNPANGALNFNGYYRGDATVIVPVGWQVDIKFLNHDGMLPHSILVAKAYGEGHIPEQVGEDQVAISKAYSRDPASGIMNGQTDDVPFTASDPGSFWLMCGVIGHALQGMWIKLEIDKAAAKPALVIASGAEPGRK